jgi:hypothetical protein
MSKSKGQSSSRRIRRELMQGKDGKAFQIKNNRKSTRGRIVQTVERNVEKEQPAKVIRHSS